jgi:tetratricopeptide (TPR) repeat protein
VAKLKASIEEKENRRRLEEEQLRQVTLMKEAMGSLIAAAEELRAKGLYYAAIEKFTEVAGAGSDTELLSKAKGLIDEVRKEMVDKRQPHVDAGNTAYDAKNYEGARDEYRKALDIDPRCQECNDGIARVRKDVHERAQKIYIEAILAESVGDLALARKKYVECYKSSVPEDDYYGRCWRKYHRFSTLEGDTQEGEQGMRAPAEALREDPYTKEAMDFL